MPLALAPRDLNQALRCSAGQPRRIVAPVVSRAMECAHQSLHSSGGAAKALSCGHNFDLDDTTLTTANTVDGRDAEPAADEQPGHQELSHRVPISAIWVTLHLAQTRVLRLSGGSEGMLRCCDMQTTLGQVNRTNSTKTPVAAHPSARRNLITLHNRQSQGVAWNGND